MYRELVVVWELCSCKIMFVHKNLASDIIHVAADGEFLTNDNSTAQHSTAQHNRRA
jgi:hypothetical protein